MVSSLVFGANLVRFATTPTRYGWRWDAMISPATGKPSDVAAAAAKLADDRSVGTVVQGLFGQIVFGGHTVPAVALGHGERDTSVVITGGRAPVSDNENHRIKRLKGLNDGNRLQTNCDETATGRG